MCKEIRLLKNNDKRNWEDLQWVSEFYNFLQGINPERVGTGGRGYQLKLSKKKAFTIIWYLQEHFPVLPDQIEQCSVCGDLFDSYESGYHSEINEKDYCSGCDHLAPESKNH